MKIVDKNIVLEAGKTVDGRDVSVDRCSFRCSYN